MSYPNVAVKAISVGLFFRGSRAEKPFENSGDLKWRLLPGEDARRFTDQHLCNHGKCRGWRPFQGIASGHLLS